MNKLMATRPSLYYSELTKKTLAAAVEKRLSLDEDHFDKAQRAALGQLAQEILAVSRFRLYEGSCHGAICHSVRFNR